MRSGNAATRSTSAHRARDAGTGLRPHAPPPLPSAAVPHSDSRAASTDMLPHRLRQQRQPQREELKRQALSWQQVGLGLLQDAPGDVRRGPLLVLRQGQGSGLLPLEHQEQLRSHHLTLSDGSSSSGPEGEGGPACVGACRKGGAAAAAAAAGAPGLPLHASAGWSTSSTSCNHERGRTPPQLESEQSATLSPPPVTLSHPTQLVRRRVVMGHAGRVAGAEPGQRSAFWVVRRAWGSRGAGASASDAGPPGIEAAAGSGGDNRSSAPHLAAGNGVGSAAHTPALKLQRQRAYATRQQQRRQQQQQQQRGQELGQLRPAEPGADSSPPPHPSCDPLHCPSSHPAPPPGSPPFTPSLPGCTAQGQDQGRVRPGGQLPTPLPGLPPRPPRPGQLIAPQPPSWRALLPLLLLLAGVAAVGSAASWLPFMSRALAGWHHGRQGGRAGREGWAAPSSLPSPSPSTSLAPALNPLSLWSYHAPARGGSHTGGTARGSAAAGAGVAAAGAGVAAGRAGVAAGRAVVGFTAGRLPPPRGARLMTHALAGSWGGSGPLASPSPLARSPTPQHPGGWPQGPPSPPAAHAASSPLSVPAEEWLPEARARVAMVVPRDQASPYRTTWGEVVQHIAQRLTWTDPTFEMRVFWEEDLGRPGVEGDQAWQQLLGALGSGRGAQLLLVAGPADPHVAVRFRQVAAAGQLPATRLFMPAGTGAAGARAGSELGGGWAGTTTVGAMAGAVDGGPGGGEGGDQQGSEGAAGEQQGAAGDSRLEGQRGGGVLEGLTQLDGWSPEEAAGSPWLQLAAQLPFTTAAKTQQLWATLQDLWSRHTSDDLLFVVLVLINQYVMPVKQVYMSSKGIDGPSLSCMVRNCGRQILGCVTNPTCKAGLDCLQACGFNDQVCQYRCIVSYETPQFEAFALCILQKHNCRSLSAEMPMRPDPAPLASFRGQPLTHSQAEDIFVAWLDPGQSGAGSGTQQLPFSWLVAAGKNPAYDFFPAQHQLFYRGRGAGVMWYEPVFKALTLDGREVWRRRRYRVRRGSTPGTFFFTVLDNGVTSNEYWRILDCDEDFGWALFYYSGAASAAGLSYSGAVLGTRDGAMPTGADVLRRLEAALELAGIKMWELSTVDNSNLEGAPLGRDMMVASVVN